MHEITLFLVKEITFFVVRIKPTKAVTSLWVNIKSIRPITSILRVYQIYKVSQYY